MRRHPDQQLVAHRMTQSVIDGLEPVEVEEADGAQFATAVGPQNRLLQTVGQQAAIGQVGQGVVICHAIKFRLVRLDLRDVREHTDVMENLSLGITHHRDRLQHHIQLTRLAFVPDLAAPEITLIQGRPEFLIKPCVMPARGQHAGRVAMHLGRRITRDAGERGVHLGDAAVGIGHHDALVTAVEHHTGFALREFQLLALGHVGMGA